MNGKKVTLQDKPITIQEAEELLKLSVSTYEKAVDSFCRDDISQSQFDALVSFAYNVGTGNLQKSTLIKKVNANPKDVTIADEFMKWNKAKGAVLKGLTRRRQAEANLYFS
jgi:lysozyme